MKILLVDDHRMMRDGLRALIARAPGLSVVGEAGDGREAVTLAERQQPDVIVMDVSMPGLNGIDATRQMLLRQPCARVIALSMHADPRYVAAMRDAGARGYVLKDAAYHELVRAIREVAAGGTFFEQWDPDPELPSSRAALTPREREILQLLAEGKSSKAMADTLKIAVSTVETHRKQIMAKLGLRSTAELTKFAVREGLTSLGD